MEKQKTRFRFFKGIKKEVTRTRWVSKDQMGKLLAMVLIFTIIFGCIFLIADRGIVQLFKWLRVEV